MDVEIIRFGSGHDGRKRIGVTWPGSSVLVETQGTDDVERTAELIAQHAKGVLALDATTNQLLESQEKLIAEQRAEIARIAALVPPSPPHRILPGAEACVRRDPRGVLWLLGNASKGWASFGFQFDSWDQLLRFWAVEVVEPRSDEHGMYWAVRNLAPAPEAATKGER